MKRVVLALASGLLFLVAACSHPGAGASRAETEASHAGPETSHASPAASQAGSGAAAVIWRGQFAGYGNSAWQRSWGYLDQGSFGQAQLSEVNDPSTPGGGPILRV